MAESRFNIWDKSSVSLLQMKNKNHLVIFEIYKRSVNWVPELTLKTEELGMQLLVSLLNC